ncbi:MAG: asparaginase domain-containing protein [Pseudomonadales bacterium]
MLDTLQIITTGGTIDKIYFDALSDYKIGDPVIDELLRVMNVGFSYDVLPLMRKDSLDISDQDRDDIFAAVKASSSTHILITHGTDTMVNTAKRLQAIDGKCIVLTGALQPAAFKSTDAIFNIGCAIGALQAAQSGVWIAMNGRVFDPLQVRKNRAHNRFESL